MHTSKLIFYRQNRRFMNSCQAQLRLCPYTENIEELPNKPTDFCQNTNVRDYGQHNQSVGFWPTHTSFSQIECSEWKVLWTITVNVLRNSSKTAQNKPTTLSELEESAIEYLLLSFETSDSELKNFIPQLKTREENCEKVTVLANSYAKI